MLFGCGNSEGWLVAWGLCECMLVHVSAVRVLPFTILKYMATRSTPYACMYVCERGCGYERECERERAPPTYIIYIYIYIYIHVEQA